MLKVIQTGIYLMTCDDCGRQESFPGLTFSEAWKASIKAAWITPNPTTVRRIHICFECPAEKNP